MKVGLVSTYSESDLSAMSRADLDQVAEELSLDPTDYNTKGDEVEAILAAQGGDTSTSTAVEPADESTQGEPASFAGLDVSTIPEGDNPDEHFQLTDESWVVLGQAEGVPDWAVGNAASVLAAPVSHKLDDEGQWLYDYTAPDAKITVRERSQGAMFEVPLDTVEKVSVHGGRSAVVNFP